ncbi:PREDICTED: uncharacterized protein LOC109150809 [Ipomoea nil]|uniref:uncharacterized protein LOC109150809 n=1 Tax=Ipomoea nil TaxID=35883 RepID=UPI0009014B8E|nr:PREDICTED: uncharacterized protein LOC109150809 [Ipomoea nil]
MASHDLVCAGVRRRIGNGRDTLIWGHPWLSDDPSPLVQTHMPEGLRQALVSGLVDQDTGTWDPHILNDLFIPEDVSRISRIPISPDYDDTWYWKGDTQGIYTVKNAYRRIMGDYSDDPGAFDKWVTLWKLRVPPKWKTFLWRAVSGILPTTDNLIVKRVEVDPICPMCGNTQENIMHVLVLCDYSKMVWNISGLPVTNIQTNFFQSWFLGMMDSLLEGQVRLAVGILYYLWLARNSALWERALPRPTATVKRAGLTEEAFTRLRRVTAQPSATVMPEIEPYGLRCYFDAGYRQHTGEATFGVVLLSHEGVFMAASAGTLPGAFSPIMAEALACKEALSWLKGRDIQRVDLITDCMELRNMIKSRSTGTRSYVGVIADQCRTIMSLFNYCSLHYISRTANMHSHTLASLAFDQEHPMYWDVIPPDSITMFIH